MKTVKIIKTLDEMTLEDFKKFKAGEGKQLLDGSVEFVEETTASKKSIALLLRGSNSTKKDFLPIPNASITESGKTIRVRVKGDNKLFVDKRVCSYVDALRVRYMGEDKYLKPVLEEAIKFDLLPEQYKECKTYDELITKVRKNNHYYDELIVEELKNRG